ncbi:hypothetical protein MKX03_035912, partial [Papaver bracteatum]
GLSLVQKDGELHHDALVKQKKSHATASYHLERENESLRRQVETLHAKRYEDGNALELMRRQHDRATSRTRGLEVMLLFLLMLNKKLMVLSMNSMTRKRSDEELIVLSRDFSANFL